jgi:WD40 repeat protein
MDQVEMIASLEQNHDVTIAFGAAIAAYATDVAPVILGVRADHLALLAADDTLRSMTESGLHFLPTLGGDDLRAAIEGPAERSGLRVESGLIELLLRDAEGQPGALPLVSHALVETWRRRDGGTLTVEAYQSSGGIRSAVARSADRLYDNLTTGEQGALRSLVLRLVASAPGGEVVRCRVPTNLIRGTSDRDHVLDLLVRARLITLEEETAELAHEALVRAWPRLRGWLDDDVAGQQVLWRLANAAGEWASTGRVDSDLYRGARLASAIEYCHGTAHDLSSIETEFLAASKQLAQSEIRAAEERTRQEAETNRRLRRSLIGIGALLAIALVAGSVALINWRAASEQRDAAQAAEDEAGIESLVNRSLALRSTNRDVAALLAVEAASQWPDDPRSLSALLGTFTGAGGFLGNRYLDGFDHLVGAMIPHTTSAVIAGEPDGLAVLDLESGALDRRFAAAVAGDSWWTVSLEVSDDGRFVVEELRVGENRCFDIEQIRAGSGGGCAALVVYDVPSGQTITGPITLPVVPDSIAIADDGALLAVNDANTGDLLLYRSTDGAQAGSVAGLPIPIDSNTVDAVAAVAFGPDGNVYVGSVAGPIRRVDPSDASVVAVYDAPAFSSNQHLSVGTDGLIVAGGNHALVAIDESDGRVVWEVSLLGTHPNPCPWFAASEAADRVYCGNLFGVVNERVRSTGQRTATSLDAQLGSVGRLSITDDGKELIAFGDAVPAISRWRLDGGGPVTSRVATGYIAGDGFDPGGTTLVVAARDQGATVDTDFSDFELWDVDEDRALESFDFDAVGVGWSGSHAVVGYLPEENVVAWYDVDSGIRIAASDIPADCEHSWMSAGGALTYCGFPDGTVWTIDGETGHRIAPTFHVASMPTAVSATRAGETVVITAFDEDGPVTTFYSGATGEALGDDLRGPWITAVSLDGVLVGASNGTVVRYDMETREPTATLAGARGEVNTLQFSDDGAVLVATALDQTVSIYDVASGIRLGDPIPSDAPFVFPGFLRPDGRAVAVTDQRGIAIWSLDRSTLIDAACKMAGRELTAIEWDTYLLSVPQRALCS